MQIQHLCQIHLIAPIHWVSVCLRMLWMNWPCCLILRDASFAAASHFPQHLQRQFFNFSLLFSLRCSALVFHFAGWSLPFSVFIFHIVLAFGIFHLKVAFLSPFLSFLLFLFLAVPVSIFTSIRFDFWVLICMPQMASERILVCLLPYWQTGISISSSAANNWICYKPCYFSMHTLFALQLMHTIPLTPLPPSSSACWPQNVSVSSNSICI